MRSTRTGSVVHGRVEADSSHGQGILRSVVRKATRAQDGSSSRVIVIGSLLVRAVRRREELEPDAGRVSPPRPLRFPLGRALLGSPSIAPSPSTRPGDDPPGRALPPAQPAQAAGRVPGGPSRRRLPRPVSPSVSASPSVRPGDDPPGRNCRRNSKRRPRGDCPAKGGPTPVPTPVPTVAPTAAPTPTPIVPRSPRRGKPRARPASSRSSEDRGEGVAARRRQAGERRRDEIVGDVFRLGRLRLELLARPACPSSRRSEPCAECSPRAPRPARGRPASPLRRARRREARGGRGDWAAARPAASSGRDTSRHAAKIADDGVGSAACATRSASLQKSSRPSMSEKRSRPNAAHASA